MTGARAAPKNRRLGDSVRSLPMGALASRLMAGHRILLMEDDLLHLRGVAGQQHPSLAVGRRLPGHSVKSHAARVKMQG
jgi:hypothetical protein